MSPDLKLAPIPCARCEGEGKIEIDVTRPHAWSLDIREVACPDCEGTGHAACVGCGARPATVRGEDDRAFCGTACAHSEGAWPDCRLDRCGLPMDPQSAPFCSTDHTTAFLGTFAERAARA